MKTLSADVNLWYHEYKQILNFACYVYGGGAFCGLEDKLLTILKWDNRRSDNTVARMQYGEILQAFWMVH